MVYYLGEWAGRKKPVSPKGAGFFRYGQGLREKGFVRMKEIGFDNELYTQKQKQHILERIQQFQGKLYLEFGGKLFDDYHASRVLPGFQPDAKFVCCKNSGNR